MKVPTLTLEGWIDTPSLKLNILFKNFLYSEYDRTFFFKTKISSFKYLLSESKDDDDLLESIRKYLTIYLERYFVTVEVEVKKIPSKDNFSYLFYITAIDKDKTYTLEHKVNTNDSVFQPIIKIT